MWVLKTIKSGKSCPLLTSPLTQTARKQHLLPPLPCGLMEVPLPHYQAHFASCFALVSCFSQLFFFSLWFTGFNLERSEQMQFSDTDILLPTDALRCLNNWLTSFLIPFLPLSFLFTDSLPSPAFAVASFLPPVLKACGIFSLSGHTQWDDQHCPVVCAGIEPGNLCRALLCTGSSGCQTAAGDAG